jgi:hypothetical protein
VAKPGETFGLDILTLPGERCRRAIGVLLAWHLEFA